MKKERGITLIALVITIIVLLILAAVSIATLTGENGILTKANEAKAQTEVENLKEMAKTDILDYQTENRSGNVTAKQLRDVLDKYFKDVPKNEEDLQKNMENPDYSLKAKDEYGKDIELKVSDIYKGTTQNPPPSAGPTVTINGETVTKEEFEKNPKNYLGKVVTNFKDEGTGTEDVNGVTVSTTYRLYWIDFDGKYEEDKQARETIYLKAECTNNKKGLGLDETNADTKNSEGKNQVKIKELNPSLYTEGVTTPNSKNVNMQAVTWLLNENNWSELKNNLTEGGIKQENINYIVGTPSLEMMMDSYNKYYNLEGTEPEPGNCVEGTRKKLFFKYENENLGYYVGPASSSKYDTRTAYYTVQNDEDIGTMYFPGSGNAYWLSSPSASNAFRLCHIDCISGGLVSYDSSYDGVYGHEYAFCPLVSLKSTTQIEIEE